MEALLGLLLLGGCTAGLASPAVSPIVIVIILASATLRAGSGRYFLILIFTGVLIWFSYGLAFDPLGPDPDPTTSGFTYEESARFGSHFLPLAALSFALMGILVGAATLSRGWAGALLLSGLGGYLVLGMMILGLLLFRNYPRRQTLETLWILNTMLYPPGGFLIPVLAAGLTRLGITTVQRRFERGPPQNAGPALDG